jgi:hypothetical protein
MRVRVSGVLGEVLGWDDQLVVLFVLLVHMHVIVIARLGRPKPPYTLS